MTRTSGEGERASALSLLASARPVLGPVLDEPPQLVLPYLARISRAVEAAVSGSMLLARCDGMTLDEIGAAFGITRQAVWQRLRVAIAEGRPQPARKAARSAIPRGPDVQASGAAERSEGSLDNGGGDVLGGDAQGGNGPEGAQRVSTARDPPGR